MVMTMNNGKVVGKVTSNNKVDGNNYFNVQWLDTNSLTAGTEIFVQDPTAISRAPSGLIFVSCPYTDEDPVVIEGRMAVVYNQVAKLARLGHIPVSPLLMHTVNTHYHLPKDWDFWGRYSIELLAQCGAMVVLMVKGWEESVGVKAEVEYAQAHNIPITYIGRSVEHQPIKML